MSKYYFLVGQTQNEEFVPFDRKNPILLGYFASVQDADRRLRQMRFGANQTARLCTPRGRVIIY
tara:strand:- start:183 stop:374 length:192 start_codon:yes stop_codon:yes gene_type:complete